MENSIFNSFQQAGLYDMMVSAAQEEQHFKLCSMLKPKIYKDGNKWCVLYGDDLQNGVVGFGDSPYLAVADFNNNFYKKIDQ